MAYNGQYPTKLKISQCRGFSKDAYTCPMTGQFGLHNYNGGHICDTCNHCASIEHLADRVEIRCAYPHVVEQERKHMELLALGLIKLFDNIIGTVKNIFIYKNKKLLTSILVVISQFLFYFVIKSIASDDSLLTITIVSICSGLGTYIAMYVNDRLQKEATFTNILTCSHEDSITELCDYLLTNKIKYIPVDSYNRENKPTKTVLAFAATRHESTLIDQFIANSEVKYLRQVLK